MSTRWCLLAVRKSRPCCCRQRRVAPICGKSGPVSRIATNFRPKSDLDLLVVSGQPLPVESRRSLARGASAPTLIFPPI